MAPQFPARSRAGAASPWKEVVDPATRRAYYWNTVTSETTWERPEELRPRSGAENTRGSATSDSVPVVDPGSLDVAKRAESWRASYRDCAGVNERLTVFFDAMPIIRAALLEREEASRRERQRQNAAITTLLDEGIAALDSILDVASFSTRSYTKYADYKAQLQRHRRVIGLSGPPDSADVDRIRQICEDVANVAANLKRLQPQSDATGDAAHLTSLCDDYGVYKKRKKQCNVREKWAAFMASRREGTNDDGGATEKLHADKLGANP